MAPPLEERDLVNVRDADRSIADFLADYPNYKEREHLLYMQQWVRGMLARHELYVARYYLKRDELDAAMMRTEYALVNYKQTGLEPEALVLLGETHMKRHEPEEAAGAFQIVLDRYPDSPFAVPARNFMKRLEKTGQLTAVTAPSSESAPPTSPAED
jgi:outer membrane protein assembly factor BamD